MDRLNYGRLAVNNAAALTPTRVRVQLNPAWPSPLDLVIPLADDHDDWERVAAYLREHHNVIWAEVYEWAERGKDV